LKNDKRTLPLSKDLKTVAVLGVLASSKKDPLGSWHCQGKEEDVVSVLEGLKRKLPKAELIHSPGVGPEETANDAKAIEEAVSAAKRAKLALVVVGERENMSGEAASRTSLSLPGRQLEMVQAVHKAGVPVVLVLMNGRPLTIPWEAENIPAIVESWFLGTRHGDAVADVLFGDFNPSGKLVVTFPRNLGQVPIYHSARNSGRPPLDPKDKWTSRYIDSPNSPQYPFGYGLSYTTFGYSGLALSSERILRNGKLQVSVKVRNTGDRAGAEVVQLYLQDPVATVTQPVKKLADFRRVELEAGEERTVEFTLPASKLGFHDHSGKYRVEPGKFNVWVGKDSADDALKGSFELTAN
jgi:beta-glucosidase